MGLEPVICHMYSQFIVGQNAIMPYPCTIVLDINHELPNTLLLLFSQT